MQIPGAWHPDGKPLAIVEWGPTNTQDRRIKIVPPEGNDETGWRAGEARDFAASPRAESNPAFSPDGRWLAYASNLGGNNQVYVRDSPLA